MKNHNHTHTSLDRTQNTVFADGYEYLKMTALARLFLENIPNHQASYVTQGPQITQLALHSGCNDFGSLMMEENVVSAASTSFQLSLSKLRQLITDAGFNPVQRDFYYRGLSLTNNKGSSFSRIS